MLLLNCTQLYFEIDNYSCSKLKYIQFLIQFLTNLYYFFSWRRLGHCRQPIPTALASSGAAQESNAKQSDIKHTQWQQYQW